MKTTSRPILATLCGVAMFLYALYLGAVGVLLPFVGASFHVGSEAQGRLFPANFAGFVVGVLLCGILSDRHGRKAVLLYGIGLYALGLLLFGNAPSFLLILLASALVGAGSGAMEVVASALAVDLYPERRAFLLNAIQIAFGAGAAVSPSVVRSMLAQGLDWKGLYLWLAAANVALLVAMARSTLPRATHPESLDFLALRTVLQQRSFSLLCLAQGLYVGAEVGFFSWMPTYFLVQLPAGGRWSGLVVTFFWAAMTVGRFATGAAVGRLPLVRLIGLLALGGVVCSVAALGSSRPPVVMLWVGLVGLCLSGIFGLILAEAGERFPGVAGSALGGVVAAGGIGGASLPWCIGALADSSPGWRGALLVVPVALAGVSLLMLRLSRD